MKPYKTLLVLLVFMVLLFGPSLFHFESIQPGGFVSIKLPQINDILKPYSEKYLADSTNLDIPDSLIIIASIAYTESELPDFRIEYFDSSDHDISLIDNLSEGEDQFRIMYYGDSQLEGDRITDYIRQELRQDAGGTGPGLLSPTMLVPYTRTAYIRSSQNWTRYNYLSYKNGDINISDFGPLLSFSRFETSKVANSEAWIRISPSSTSDSLAQEYNTLRIIYGNLEDSLSIEIEEDRKID